MTTLDEMQFEILPTVDAAEGLGFGLGFDVSITNGGFDPGGNSWETQDTRNPTRGNTNFGRDILGGPTWAWSMHTDMDDTAGALEALRAIRNAWSAREIRDVPGAVLPIRYRMGDRVRRVYGRPRNFAAPPDNQILGGYVPITADFACVDGFTYDDDLSTATLTSGSITAPGTGFQFPTTFPASTLGLGEGQIPEGAINVGGDEDTYPVVRFNGDVTRPWLSLDGGWRMDLDVILGPLEYVVVDTRAWVSSVVKNGSQYIGGALGRRQWMADMFLSPGNHTLRFGAETAGAGATCTVSWRNAWSSI